MEWEYFVLGIIFWQIVKMLAMAIASEITIRRHKKFLRLVNIRFPDRRDISFISVESSDKRSLQEMERELRETYGLEPPEPEEESMVLRLPRRDRPNQDDVDR